MERDQDRASADGYCVQILIINGEVQEQSDKSFYIENIGKGGFRFLADVSFELEDRVKGLLRFPDGTAQEVLGRIYYSDEAGTGQTAYGFSVIEGFYSLRSSTA